MFSHLIEGVRSELQEKRSRANKEKSYERKMAARQEKLAKRYHGRISSDPTFTRISSPEKTKSTAREQAKIVTTDDGFRPDDQGRSWDNVKYAREQTPRGKGDKIIQRAAEAERHKKAKADIKNASTASPGRLPR